MANPENLEGQGFHTDPSRINRAGRPKGSKSRSTIAKQFAEAVTGGLNLKGDTCPDMTAEELMIAALWRKAIDGDIAAIKEIQDTLYGKISDKLEANVTTNPIGDILNGIDGTTASRPVEGPAE